MGLEGHIRPTTPYGYKNQIRRVSSLHSEREAWAREKNVTIFNISAFWIGVK